MPNPFKIGDKVYKNYPFDGTPKQGYPDKRQVFIIEKISDHKPVDGLKHINAVCYLKPGVSWSFYWNLSSYYQTQFPAHKEKQNDKI